MEKMKLPTSIWKLDEMIFNFTYEGGRKAKELIDNTLYENGDKGELHQDAAKLEGKAKAEAKAIIHDSVINNDER